MKKLLVVISDRLSNLIEKGEITENYYNPKNYFDQVDILMTNDDIFDISQIQKMVGTAKLTVHNLPTGRYFLLKTLFWRPLLLNLWCKKGINLISGLEPDLIRCYGNRLSGYFCHYIKNKLGIPYVLSMHEDPDNIVKSEKRLMRSIQYILLESIGCKALEDAEKVIVVNSSIINYLEKRGIKNYSLIYNAVNINHINLKHDYKINGRVNIICPGRLIKIKNPKNLIKAVCELDNVHLTIIGDGDYREKLCMLSEELNCKHKVTFIKAINNDELCKSLASYDIFAIQCNGIGIPKTILEAWLAGLPIITSKPETGDTKEFLNEENILIVEDSVKGYKEGIVRLIENENLRKKIGIQGYIFAEQSFNPVNLESQVIEIYNSYFNK